MQARLVPISASCCSRRQLPVDNTPWVPLTRWSDIPVGLVAKFVVLPLVVVAVVWARAVRAHRERANYNSPRRLFNELCALHQLDWPTPQAVATAGTVPASRASRAGLRGTGLL